MAVERMIGWLGAVVLVVIPAAATAGQTASSRLAFQANDKGEYTFDTGVLRGALRPEGKSRGLSSVVHIPSGTRLDRSMGMLGYYRVFTTNHRYGPGAWYWPSTATLLPDGAVLVTWPEAADRPFEMTALYRWKDPQTIDVQTTVTAGKDLTGFESFLATYLDEAFPSPFAYIGESPDANGKPGFLLAAKSHGTWQMFPRDARSLPTIHDGRWKLDPNPVDWAIMPQLAAPVCLRRSSTSDLAVILMASPQDCFAIATPHAGEGHYSLYLSLFGHNIKAGETATAHTRLIITTGASDNQVLARYRQYLNDLPRESTPTN